MTAAALYILQHHAYNRYCLGETRDAEDLSKFEDWCCQRGEDVPQFHYWATVLELELLVLVYVHSLRQGSLMMYLDALTELDPGSTHWTIPTMHLKDMAKLTTKHPDIATKFWEGHFTVQKTHRVFSSIQSDQAHKQNNACIKGDGGAVGLTDGEAVLSKPLLPDLTSLAPCNHEEADSQVLLHVSHTAQHGHHAILIRTVDTDVVVMAVSLAQELQPEDELWLAFGTGQS